jgi:hypothetical protein
MPASFLPVKADSDPDAGDEVLPPPKTSPHRPDLVARQALHTT